VVAVWDLETTDKNALVAEVAEVYMTFYKVAQVDEKLTLVGPVRAPVDTFVRPIGGKSSPFLRAHGIQDGDLASARDLLPVVDDIIVAMRNASDLAGQHEGQRRLWLLGHNSHLYDMRVMHFALGRREEPPGGWARRLAEVGVVGLFDSLKFLSKPFEALAEDGFNRRNGSLEAIHTKLFSQELQPAHRAGGDVKGLVKIVQQSEGMRKCLCEKNTGVTLGAWVTYNTQLIDRKRMQAAAELERTMSPAPEPHPGACVGNFGPSAMAQGP
jgi:hypothetical protein